MNVFNVKKNSIWAYTHSLITEKCQKKFMDGHYADSVETAMKEMIARIRKFRADAGHKEIQSECNMMENTFADGKSLLHITACSTESERNIHRGYARMLIGAVQGIRNPIAHDSVDMTEGDAARKLMLASDLMYRLDEAFEAKNAE